ncbi:recombinase family protein [Pedococcus sp. KACC 23699]|uniref:Recombinase family protein n=1 Tax=Pedococcus sp. KACC 23699 TaxID=3149228 RepID=A0AAU7JVC2_9MICO
MIPGRIAYVRVSTARDEMVAPEIQIDAMRAWAAQHHVPILDVVQDLDQSGRGFAKRKIASIIERIQRGEASGALVYNFSRFGRNATLALAHIAELEAAGGSILSATEPVDPETAIGRFTRTTALAVAELQSDQISDGWKAAIARRVKHGLPGDGQPRFGYVYHRAAGAVRSCPQGCPEGTCTTGYVLHPSTASILRNLYLSYLDGTSLPALAERLQVEGIASVRGGRWVTTTVRDMLDNGFGAGLVSTKGHFADGAHPPVISADEWAAYVRRRDESRTVAPRHRNAVHSTAGIAVCGLCGNSMVAASTRRDGKGYILRCGRMQSSGRGACAGVWIVRKSVDAAVLEWLKPAEAILTRAAALAATIRPITHLPTVPSGQGELRRQGKDLERRIQRITDAYEAEAFPLDEFLQRRAAAQAALDEVEHGLSEGAASKEVVTSFQIKNLIEQWEQFSSAAQRDVLKVLIERIVIHPRDSPIRVEIQPSRVFGSTLDLPITRQ